MRTASSPPALPVGQVGSWGELSEADERENERSLPAVFAERVAASPEALAIAGEGVEISYEELDRRSNRVAAGLLNEPDSDTPVALLVADAVESAVVLLGILKAGRAALPLDPRAPQAALARTLSLSRAALVLADAALPLPSRIRQVGEYTGESDRPVEVPIEPGSGAVVAFTSGSTGEPKGLLRPHRMLVHRARSDRALSGIGIGTRIVVKRGPNMHLHPTLLAGATALMYDPARLDVHGLAAWLTENRAEIVRFMPSMIDPLLAGAGARGLPTLRVVKIGGEKVGRARARALQQVLQDGAKLVHHYGSTETGSVCFALLENPVVVNDEPLAAGFAEPGVSISLRDPDGAPAQSGEIVVESRYLAQPWDPAIGVRAQQAVQVCRTGDLGRIEADGQLTILGRLDRMVKVRGFRVQLDAVEHALLALDTVEAAAVVDEPSPRGTRRIAAYVELGRGERPERARSLRTELARSLPDYMLPQRIVAVERLPRLAGGKVDLPTIAATASSDSVAAPRGPTEERLAAIWASVLELDRVGRNEGYLELGGDSLNSAVIAAEVFASFGVELTARVLDETPTVARMAAVIDQLQARPPRRVRPPLRRAASGAALPLGLSQEAYWRDALATGNELSYNLGSALALTGELDADALVAAIEELVRRHDILRTTFKPRRGRPLQVVHQPPFIDLEVCDLRGDADPHAGAARLLAEERKKPFELERGPLVRFRLVRTGAQEHQLIQITHHTISDAWSSGVTLGELAELYAAYRDGRPSPLPELTIQYGDYAAWERGHVRRRSRYFWDEIAWWRRTLTPRPEPLQLPFARPAPAADADAADGLLDWTLPGDLSQVLDGLERDCGASYFVVRLAAISAHLLEVTNRRDLLVGVNITARRLPELQGTLGLLANMTVLRLRAPATASFREWVGCVRRAVAETSEHFAIPYGAFPWAFRGTRIGVPGLELIVAGERSSKRSEWEGLPGLVGRRVGQPRSTGGGAIPRKFDLRFVAGTGNGAPEACAVRFDPRRYDPVAVRAFLDRFAGDALGFCVSPDAPLWPARDPGAG